MTDSELQASLNRLARLSNAIQEEAERRYGKTGFLFFEAGGGLHVMDGDANYKSGAEERQSHIRFSANILSRMGAGAW